jgi:hypothetical protein
MWCTKCGRRLKNPSPNGMGPVCARAVLGAKHKRQRAEPQRDERTRDMFAEDLAYANRVDVLLSSISLEMPHG